MALAQTASLVVSVDWHRGDEGSGAGWTLPEFCGALSALGLWEKVVPVVGRSEDFLPYFAKGVFDLVWIDGAHDAESVELDTHFALDLLNERGVIAWHDWNYPSVREGVGRVLNIEQCRHRAGAIATWER